MTAMQQGHVRHRIPLDPVVPRAHADELGRRVFFVSDAIVAFDLIGRDAVTALDVVVPEHTDIAELARKLEVVVTRDVLARTPSRGHIVWGAEHPPVTDVYPELVERGIAVEVGQGQVAFGEPVLALTEYLDARLRNLVVREFGATEYRYPTLIATDVMRRCGYFGSFPQLMMFVSRLHTDVDAYRDFLTELTSGADLSALLRERAADVDHCLPPTMCFHTFAQLADARLAGPAVYTARGKSFRHEARYHRSLERLWDFTIREIVFLGSQEQVLRQRQRLMELVFELAGELGLGGRCEVANDPFFVSADTPDRVWSQRLLQLKYELRMPLDEERDVAVGSFNYHERFFARSFGIVADRDVHTGCAGFGLERFAYAFLCRHGLDPRHWPAEVRRAVVPAMRPEAAAEVRKAAGTRVRGAVAP
jgi:seryl-tRNA synthetase